MKFLYKLVIFFLIFAIFSCTKNEAGDDQNQSNENENLSTITAYIDYEDLLENEDLINFDNSITYDFAASSSGIISPVTIPTPAFLKEVKSPQYKSIKNSSQNINPLYWVATNLDLKAETLSSDITASDSWITWALPDASTWIASVSVEQNETFRLYLVSPSCIDLTDCLLTLNKDSIVEYESFYGAKQFSVSTISDYDIGTLSLDANFTEPVLASSNIAISLDGFEEKGTLNTNALAIYTVENSGSYYSEATLSNSNMVEYNEPASTNSQFLKCDSENEYYLTLSPSENASSLIKDETIRAISVYASIKVHDNNSDETYKYVLISEFASEVESLASKQMFKVRLQEDPDNPDDSYLTVNILENTTISLATYLNDSSYAGAKLEKGKWYFFVLTMYFFGEASNKKIGSDLYVFNEAGQGTRVTGYESIANISNFSDYEWAEAFSVCHFNQNNNGEALQGISAIPNIYLDNINIYAKITSQAQATSIFNIEKEKVAYFNN
ncbi:MAG: hypothetical protein ABIA04_04135 [Pseudomonadota bacterium]